MTTEDVPVLVGKLVRLRPMVERDVVVRAGLGRNREIVRWFGGDLEADAPMAEIDARAQLEKRFGPGPHWSIGRVVDWAVSHSVRSPSAWDGFDVVSFVRAHRNS